MRQVERKAANSRRAKRLWVILAAALIAFASLLIWFLQKPVQMPSIPSVQRRNVVLLSVERDQLRTFTAKPTHAPPYTFALQGSVFVPEGHPDFNLDSNQLEVILGTLAHIEAADDFGPLELLPNETLEDFGLGEAAFILEAAYADGHHIKLSIGSRVYGELPLDYMMVEGVDTLYAISADIRDTFDRPLNHFHHVPAINFTPELVSSVIIRGPHPFTIKRLEHDLWAVEEPYRYPAEKTMIQQLLKQIDNMRLATFVAPETKPNLAKYGFTDTAVHVSFELVPSTITAMGEQGEVVATKDVSAQTIALTFGESISDTGWYCLYDGAIYQASDLSMGFLMRDDWRTFASTSPMDIPLSAVHNLTIENGGAKRMYQIALTEQILPNNQLLLDDTGTPLYNFLITLHGQEVDPVTITQPYTSLMEMRTRGRLPAGYHPRQPALLSIGVDAGMYNRCLDFYEYDALHVALCVDGTFIHYVDRSILDAMSFD